MCIEWPTLVKLTLTERLRNVDYSYEQEKAWDWLDYVNGPIRLLDLLLLSSQ